MMRKLNPPISIFTLLSTAFASMLAGCSWIGFEPKQAGCPVEAVPGIAVVVGNRANSPAAAIPPAELDTKLEPLILRSRESKVKDQAIVGVNVIRLDGQPAIACVIKLDVNTHNTPAEEKASADFRNRIHTEVNAVRAKVAEADVFRALSLAADSVGNGGTIILVDSGLQTLPPLNFVGTNLVGAEPAQILERLTKLTPLPDLAGKTVVLAGIGYTAAPQKPLHEGQRQLLIRLWKALAENAGAKQVIVVTQPNTAESFPELPKVTPVSVPDPGTVRFICGSQTVLRNDGAVGFEPDEAIFLHEESARQALKQLADFLAANPDAHVTLTGNVAHYGSGKGGLDLRRATAVKNLLVEFGVTGSRIRAVGDGWGPYPTKDAGPDPAFDQQNRRVVVAISCG
jgi:outer membrane protein OmpA-like peptidoglycan-associated protein